MDRQSGFLLRCLQLCWSRRWSIVKTWLVQRRCQLHFWGSVPNVAALVWSEKTLNTPTDRSDRSDRVMFIQVLIIKHGWSTARRGVERRGYTISGVKGRTPSEGEIKETMMLLIELIDLSHQCCTKDRWVALLRTRRQVSYFDLSEISHNACPSQKYVQDVYGEHLVY